MWQSVAMDVFFKRLNYWLERARRKPTNTALDVVPNFAWLTRHAA